MDNRILGTLRKTTPSRISKVVTFVLTFARLRVHELQLHVVWAADGRGGTEAYDATENRTFGSVEHVQR